MSKKRLAAKWFNRLGGASILHRTWGKNRLTVLAYHRIIEHQTPTFADYRPVVSATPADFRQQMAFLKTHFSVISLDNVHRALANNAALPDYPLLITFDDGYLDNYQNAYPILREFGFPAVIFLATSRMTDPTPLWWDAVARYFHHTQTQHADLPLIGAADITPATLDRLLAELKKIPEDEKLDAVEAIRQSLNVTVPDAEPLFMNWEQVREVVNNGIACQSHTVTHPIMTRIAPDEVRRQLAESRQRIIDETGQTVTAFAYPNGTPADYSPDTMKALHETGYQTAYTLSAGPMAWQAVQAHPYQIRRVYLGYQDSFDLFQAKVMGLPAIGSSLAYPDAST